jgi:hypothetical protein
MKRQLGNTILVKLELWESVMVIISFGLPLTYAYTTPRKVWQVIRHFGALFFAIQVPLKQIFKFVTKVNIVTPYFSPYGYPNDVPVGQKMVEHTKWWSRQMY